ncbi:MAG: hypothetical protein ABIJ65_06215 [Chloroflexota bacterium]
MSEGKPSVQILPDPTKVNTSAYCNARKKKYTESNDFILKDLILEKWSTLGKWMVSKQLACINFCTDLKKVDQMVISA